MNLINTVTGTCSPDQLGVTLTHEHLMIGWAGWETDSTVRFDRKAAISEVTAKVKELRDLGLETFVDPCPMDLGRDPEFMAEVAQGSQQRFLDDFLAKMAIAVHAEQAKGVKRLQRGIDKPLHCPCVALKGQLSPGGIEDRRQVATSLSGGRTPCRPGVYVRKAAESFARPENLVHAWGVW